MRIGLIARADNTGLGTQTWEFFRNMRPHKTLIVDLSERKQMKLYPQRFPDAKVVGVPTVSDYVEFLQDLDVVFTCETPYIYDLFSIARGMGVKSVLQYNYEFLDYLQYDNIPWPDLLLAPSPWHYAEVVELAVGKSKTQFLPVPIDLSRYEDSFQSRLIRNKDVADHFVHVVGRPAIHDRNGTDTLLNSLKYVVNDITLTLYTQDALYLNTLLTTSSSIPKNVNFNIRSLETENYWEMYEEGDVLIMPRRFGGLCLPVNEAIGAGMPVIMPDCSPNNMWLPEKWLTPCFLKGTFQARSPIDLFESAPHALGWTIDQFASDEQLFKDAKRDVVRLRRENSWEVLREQYNTMFDNL